MATTTKKPSGRKARDKRYREKHKEEIAVKKREWAQANRLRLNEQKNARRHRAIEKAIEDLTEYYFYAWVSPVGADHLFDSNEIWANKNAIYGWLVNEENWDEEDRKNFAKIRKKNIPRLADGVHERVLKQIESNKATLSVEW